MKQENCDQLNFADTLREAITERNQLFEFIEEQINQLIEPITKAITEYISLPSGGIEMQGCDIEDDVIVIVGAVMTSTGDQIAEVHFGIPIHMLGNEIEPPTIDTLVRYMAEFDSKREIKQKDTLIEMMREAETRNDYQEGKVTIPTVQTMHLSNGGETLIEYTDRNNYTSKRSIH